VKLQCSEVVDELGRLASIALEFRIPSTTINATDTLPGWWFWLGE
jgi:hypothetical protein